MPPKDPPILSGSGSTDPTSQRIAEVIDARFEGTILAGTGREFVAAGLEYGVDPLALAAIAGHESGSGPGSRGVVTGSHNPFGLGGPGNWMNFGSFGESIRFAARLLSGDDYAGDGRTTLAGIGSKWAPASDPRNGGDGVWARAVVRHYDALADALGIPSKGTDDSIIGKIRSGSIGPGDALPTIANPLPDVWGAISGWLGSVGFRTLVGIGGALLLAMGLGVLFLSLRSDAAGLAASVVKG